MNRRGGPHYRWNDDCLEIRVKVVPRSSKDAIAGLLGDRLKVTITAPPVDGKANAHLIRWFAKLFGVPKSLVEIIAGENSRIKTVAIRQIKVVPNILLVPDERKTSDFE